jgi:hypothetical protein
MGNSIRRMLMNPAASARTVQLIGAGLLIVGGILMWVGTTSVPLFVFYGVLTIAGILVFVQGKKMYEKTLG